MPDTNLVGAVLGQLDGAVFNRDSHGMLGMALPACSRNKDTSLEHLYY